MIFIIYFVLGIFFYQVIAPLLDELISLLISMLESVKGYFNVKITKYNNEALKITNELTEQNTYSSAIGFTIPKDEEDQV